MDPVEAMAIMAAIGAAKSEFVDKPKEARDRKYQAQLASTSGWTHMAPEKPFEQDFAGSTIGGGLTGLEMSQRYPTAFQTKDAVTQPTPDMSQSAWAPMGSTDPNNPPRTTMYDRSASGYPIAGKTTRSAGAVGNSGNPAYGDWLAMDATGRGRRAGY